MASSSSDSSDSELWGSDDEKENVAERTVVGRACPAAKASPSVAALAARVAGKEEGLARQRQMHERLLRAHRAQTEELQAARDELQELRYAQPRLQRELEVAHETTRKAVDARRKEKVELQQRLLQAEEAADSLSARCREDVRALAQRLQDFAATPGADAPVAAQLVRDASRHTASIAADLGHDDVASELRHLCPSASQCPPRMELRPAVSPSPPSDSPSANRHVNRAATLSGEGHQPEQVSDRSDNGLAAQEQASLIQAYRVALLKERKRSAVLQRTAAAAQEERDQLQERFAKAGASADSVRAPGTEQRKRAKDFERREPLRAEVETLKALAANATLQVQEALEAAKCPPPRVVHVQSGRDLPNQPAEATVDELGADIAGRHADHVSTSSQTGGQLRHETAVSGSETLQRSEVNAWHQRLLLSESVIRAQQLRVAELEALVADQKRDLQAALGMVIRRATPSPPDAARIGTALSEHAAHGADTDASCAQHAAVADPVRLFQTPGGGAGGGPGATPTASAAKWLMREQSFAQQ